MLIECYWQAKSDMNGDGEVDSLICILAFYFVSIFLIMLLIW